MKTCDHKQAAESTGQPYTEGSVFNNPQGSQNQPAILKLTRAEYARIPQDYKSWWTRPAGERVRVVLRGCPTGGVTLVEVEIV